MPFRFLLAAVIALAACGPKTQPPPDLTMRTIALPGGQNITVEILYRQQDMARGMMFRQELAADRGLLFLHPRAGKFSYWMHNVKVPLDIIWLDNDHRIVEIAARTPPCLESDPVRCPQYGGNHVARFVLELAGGMAARYGLAVGQTIPF